ncbi:MAG: (2Fe-2S) ferredoxin domain-containing protein [Alphaproteobacteria bacterium]|nr:(2Fe-2S) ferredoxin domain-containing protein [Alphaproteobacteria bacterium]
MSTDEQDLHFTHHIFCCSNERPAGHPRGCCKEKGADALRNYMKVRAKEMGLEGTRVNNAGCLDRCELGPTVVVYPEGVWYSIATREDVDEILEKHIKGGDIVTRLQLKKGQTELTEAQKQGRSSQAASDTKAG